LIGTIPDFIAASRRGSDESVHVPGGLAVVERAGAGWRVRDMLEHDGTKLSQISAAARYGDRVILGSPFSKGILVCSL